MVVLVTGGTGFVGSRTADRLQESGHSVKITGRDPTGSDQGQHQYLQLDLLQQDQCLQALEGVEAVVHCAGMAGAWGRYESFFAANVMSTENLLKACKKRSVRRFVNLSSPSIVFDYHDQFNLKETDLPPKFSNFYAETKYKAEQRVHEANSDAFSTISLRPRGVIGAGDKNWMPRIIDMRRRDQLVQPGPGENVVDFTSIENLLDAIEICLSTTLENCGRAYNITNDEPVKLWTFIEDALSHFGLDAKRKRVPRGLAMAAAKVSEAVHVLLNTQREPALLPIKVGVAAYSMTLDITDAKQKLGYRPRASTRKALEEFVAWNKTGKIQVL